MERIKLNDNLIDVVMKMSDGNPGAINVLMQLMQPDIAIIDPENLLGSMGVILMLDSIGIYGTDIYVLMNDICENNMVKFVTVIKSVQLGLLNENVVKDAASRQDYSGKDMIDIDKLHQEVKKQIPTFQDL